MKYFSEKTNKYYDTAEDCMTAEGKFEGEQARLKQEREIAEKEVNELKKQLEVKQAELKDCINKYTEQVKTISKDIDALQMEIVKKVKKDKNHITFSPSDCVLDWLFW